MAKAKTCLPKIMKKTFGVYLIMIVMFSVVSMDLYAVEIKVLMSNGATTKDYKACLKKCNEMNLIPGFTFTWESTSYVDAGKLAGKDIVMYPGGTVKAKDTDIPALQSFISNGGGYYGTCAGAGSAIGCFELTPHVKTIGTHFQGPVDVRLTEWGTRVFGYGGNQMIKCYNGMSFFLEGGKVFADLAHWHNNHDGDIARTGDSNIADTGYWKADWDTAGGGTKYKQSYVDYYGKGRVIVINAHPEIGRRAGYYWYPRWVGAGVVWASGHMNALSGYILGYDQGYYSDGNFRRLSSSADYDMICQKEYISADGIISSISVLKSNGTGKLIVGIYTGDTRPETCLVQSNPVSADGKTGWQTVNLKKPYKVTKGETIWLAFMFQDTNHKYYYKRFVDKKGNTFEKRVWASSAGWPDFKGNNLPDSPSGSIEDYLVCVFTTVSPDK